MMCEPPGWKNEKTTLSMKTHLKATQPLEIVHVDLCRPMPMTSAEGNKYSKICTNDRSFWRDVSYFDKQSDASRALILYKARAEKFHLKSGYKWMGVQRNQGGLTSKVFIHKLALSSLELNLTALYTPQQEGIAQMSKRIIINIAIAITKWTGCSNLFSVPGIETVVYSRNRSKLRALWTASTSYKL